LANIQCISKLDCFLLLGKEVGNDDVSTVRVLGEKLGSYEFCGLSGIDFMFQKWWKYSVNVLSRGHGELESGAKQEEETAKLAFHATCMLPPRATLAWKSLLMILALALYRSFVSKVLNWLMCAS
jgi:hypothetical protein